MEEARAGALRFQKPREEGRAQGGRKVWGGDGVWDCSGGRLGKRYLREGRASGNKGAWPTGVLGHLWEEAWDLEGEAQGEVRV